ELLRTSGGNEVCRVAQLSARPAGSQLPTAPGWYYELTQGTDPDTALAKSCGANSQRIRYSEDFKPVTGTSVRLECLQPAQSVSESEIDVGGFCDPDSQSTGTSPDGISLICDTE